jgi:predicted nucleic acid-binding protein
VRIVADTGGIVAAMNTAEPDHEQYRATLESASLAVITPPVITEVHYLLSSAGAHQTAQDFLEDVEGGFYELAAPSADDYVQAGALIQLYAGKMQRKPRKPGSLDLADAMNIVTANRYGTNLLLATDQDYRITRPLSGHPYFVLLPQDSRE